jgi:hypothetical protein
MRKRLARDKHPSLLQKFINYGQKSFMTFSPGGPTRAKDGTIESENVIKIFHRYLSKMTHRHLSDGG